jgi:hypothetical protein
MIQPPKSAKAAKKKVADREQGWAVSQTTSKQRFFHYTEVANGGAFICAGIRFVPFLHYCGCVLTFKAEL